MEISNNMLVILVVAAMAVSISGTMTMLSVIPGTGFGKLAGMDTETQTGTAQVTLAQETAIKLLVSTVDFHDIAGVAGTTNDTTDYSPHPFVLKNNGTVKVNVSIAESTGDPLWSKDDSCESCFQFNSSPNGSIGAAAYYDWKDFSAANWAENASAADVDALNANLIYNLTTDDTGNAWYANINLNITVPDAEPAGPKSATIFFKAAGVGP